MRNFQYRGAILTSPQTNQRGLMRCHSMIIWLILNALVNALALRSWCKTFTNAYFSSQWIFQVFLFNPLPEVAHYRNQASVKVDPDKPHTLALAPFSVRKVFVFGAQLSSCTGLFTTAGYPPLSQCSIITLGRQLAGEVLAGEVLLRSSLLWCWIFIKGLRMAIFMIFHALRDFREAVLEIFMR